MTHERSVLQLAHILRASNRVPPVLLLGAGASFTSGVPLAAEAVKRLAKRVYADRVRGGSVLPEQLKLSEWQDWLQGHDWFLRREDRLAENWPLVVERLLTPREYRRQVLLDLMRRSTSLSTGYENLAAFMMRGLVGTVLTTNFDACLPEALHALRPHIPHVAEVNASPGDYVQFNSSPLQIVWLHGRAEHYSDCNLLEETERLDPGLVELLVPLLIGAPLIVIGYRGAEHSVMADLLTAGAHKTHNFRNGIYWCVRRGEPLHARVQELRGTIGSNFITLEVEGFDEVMADLSRELRDEDRYANAKARQPTSRPLPFDDQPIEGAGLEELDWDLMLLTMRQYCEKLGRAPVTRDTLPALLQEQGLIVSGANGRVVPTVGCLLLFGLDPQERWPHATVAATLAGKKRVVCSGNLLRQRDQLREWLTSSEVNPLLRVKGRTRHEDRPAYPERALNELLVNLLVHRDYETEDCARIDAEPGGSLRFENPGGLLDAVVQRLCPDDKGEFRPVPNVTALRNRALCDVFFGIREMERGGTGLSDVYDLAREGGGTARFTHDAHGRRFVARIFQPTASAGTGNIARNNRPTGIYVLNTLPLASIPEGISEVPLCVRLSERPAELDLKPAGTFILKDSRLWSFVPLDTLKALLGPIIIEADCVVRTREEMESNAEYRDVLSWLIRKHFERHLEGFRDRGLHSDRSRQRGRRAYFHGRDGGSRTIVYDTGRRRGIRRRVVKQRQVGAKAWFENEGFGYEVVQVDREWAIRIKPFYMFTGRDAETPLPAFTRASRATRRIKFDRNKNVDDDLTFWARFLSGSAPSVNIGQEHVLDLILSGTFLTVEVPESEDATSDGENRNRMPA